MGLAARGNGGVWQKLPTDLYIRPGKVFRHENGGPSAVDDKAQYLVNVKFVNKSSEGRLLWEREVLQICWIGEDFAIFSWGIWATGANPGRSCQY
jgi:hypothetical protein